MKRSARRLALAAAVAALTTTAASAQQRPGDWTGHTNVAIPSPSDSVQSARRSISDLGATNTPKPIQAARFPSPVRMAAAVAATDSAGNDSDSLLDLDIPIPGIPGPQAVSSKPIRLPRLGRTSQNSATSAKVGTARLPEVASKGGKLKIRIEPVRLDAETGEVLQLGNQLPTDYVTPGPSDAGIVGGAAEFELTSPDVSANQEATATGEFGEATVETVMSLSDSSSLPMPAANSARDDFDTSRLGTVSSGTSGSVEISLSDTSSTSTGDPLAMEDSMSGSGIAPQTPTFSIGDTGEPGRIAGQLDEGPQENTTAFSMRDSTPAARAPVALSMEQAPVNTPSDEVETTKPYEPAHKFADSTMPYRMATAARTPATTEVDAGKPEPTAEPKKLSADQLSGTPMRVGESMVVAAHGMTDLAASSRIIEYSVEHPSICRLIRTGETTLSVVGLQEGSTRVAVVTASADGSPQTVEVRSVAVQGGVNQKVEKRDFARDITQTISKLYPRCQISVVNRGEEIVVRGFAESEKDARRILSMVRKATLSPVIDEVRSFVR